jgi:hypothetical protein
MEPRELLSPGARFLQILEDEPDIEIRRTKALESIFKLARWLARGQPGARQRRAIQRMERIIQRMEQIQQKGFQHDVKGARDLQDPLQRSLWHYAVTSGSQEFNKFLCKWQVNVNMADGNGSFPIHYAAQCGIIPWWLDLFNRSVDPNVTVDPNAMIDPNSLDGEGRTPLQVAVQYGQLDSVEKLVAREDIDIGLCDQWGRNVFATAMQYWPMAPQMFSDSQLERQRFQSMPAICCALLHALRSKLSDDLSQVEIPWQILGWRQDVWGYGCDGSHEGTWTHPCIALLSHQMMELLQRKVPIPSPSYLLYEGMKMIKVYQSNAKGKSSLPCGS